MAIARTFAAEGASVVGFDIAAEAGAAVARRVVADGGAMRFVHGDVTSEGGVATAVAGVLADHGRIDVLVNNAAIQKEARLVDVTVEDFHRVMNVNLLGYFLFCRAVLPPMIAGGPSSTCRRSTRSADPLLPV
jgi:NAD(P)-dependent dehydrogenase (short-subunit alcohol dehydrogenase family)